MKVIRPNITVVDKIDGDEILKKVEAAARICYQSPSNDETREQFLANIIKSGHTSVIEHEKISVVVICSRAISHELVRHRIASYSQESTRYVNYKNKGMQFIRPITIVDNPVLYGIWEHACEESEKSYEKMIENGARPQEARCVLNNALKTQIKITMNMRSWRNFFTLRCAKGAHPHMKEIAIAILLFFKERIPVLFDDIEYDEEFWNKYVTSKGESWHEYVISYELMEESGLV